MFGMGMGELLIVLVLALIVFGPQKLPELAAQLGKAIRQFRKVTQDLTSQLEIDEDVKQPLRELRAALRDEPAPPIYRPIVDQPATLAPAEEPPPLSHDTLKTEVDPQLKVDPPLSVPPPIPPQKGKN